MKIHLLGASIFCCCAFLQCQIIHKHPQTLSSGSIKASQHPKMATTMDTIHLKNCPTADTTIQQGQVLVCYLKAYPSKGYSWLFDSETHRLASVQFKGRTVQKATSETLDGAATFNLFTFVGKQKGTDTLTFKYLRPFDPPKTLPLETCVFKIHVE